MRSAKDNPETPGSDDTGQVKAGGRGKPGVPRSDGDDRDMGSALRSIYQRTVEESVPDEMLSLLGKLD